MVDSPKLGAKVRALRRRESLTQAQLADRLGISPSYLNLIENNRRTLSASLLIKLAKIFELDVHAFAQDDYEQTVSNLLEVFADPMFEVHQLTQGEVQELATSIPSVAAAILTLHRVYENIRDSAGSFAERYDDGQERPGAGAMLPPEEVTDFFQRADNYFPELEEAADSLWQAARLDPHEVRRGLIDYLSAVRGVTVRVDQESMMRGAIRRFDTDHDVLQLGEVLAPKSRNFQLAYQIALLDHRELLDRLVRDPALTSDASKRLARVGLANYFAGAVMMPYERFLGSAKSLRYDIELLCHRFRTSFEQVCHRLATLRRPGAEGVPFHLVRIDLAGNISKRFSASGFRFARFSGACPRWNEHAAFLAPGLIRTQVSEMPDGKKYLCIARTVRDELGGYQAPHAMHAVGIGCDLHFAHELVYSEGIRAEGPGSAVPIGVTCRVCDRSDCEQRAFPSVMQPMTVDENVRGRSLYVIPPNL